jgi:hypothetical protein
MERFCSLETPDKGDVMSKKNFTAKAVRNAAKTVAARDKAERNIVVDSAPAVVVDSETDSKPITPFTARGERKMELTRINHNRKGSNLVYSFGEGTRGTVKIAASVFGPNPPETLPQDVSQWPVQVGQPKAKMTKEERAAARAAMTPQDKVAAAKARAAKAAERAAKLEASLLAGSPA